jgi:glutaredoxin
MKIVKVSGKNKKHKVFLYALSTCGWCSRTKKFLSDHDIAYEYVDVDLCSPEDRENIIVEILGRGGSPRFPTIIVDDKVLITGFEEEKIKEALEI